MNDKFKILFVMPVLRTPTYTKLAYESLMENTDSRHKVVVCLDIDNADDREFYEKHGIPYKVRQGWGHWMMTNWEVFDAMRTGAPYNFVGLIHNDMVFGANWLAGLEQRFEQQPDLLAYKDTIFSFNHIASPLPKPPPQIDKDIFGYDAFIQRTLATDTLSSRTELHFLPWVWSFDFHKNNEHCQWLYGGDYAIYKPYHTGIPMKFIPVNFGNSGVVHFGNVACQFHNADFLRLQTTKTFFPELAKDVDFIEMAEYMVATTAVNRDNVGLRDILNLKEDS